MNTAIELQIKVDDVFRIRYTQTYMDKYPGRDLNHCFEGLAVAMQTMSGMLLVDTFWGIKRYDNKVFSIDKIGVDIDIEYYCNLNEITKITKKETQYYADEDIVILHDQHGCSENCKYYYKKIGSTRSREKMIKTVKEKLEKAQYELKSANDRIIQYSALQEVVLNSSDLDSIYL